MKIAAGKIPVNILKEVVFKNLGVKKEEVALGPSVGFDGAVIDFDDKSIVVSTDPITGAIDNIGWLAVHINANDIATFGVKPEFFLSCILLSENSSRETLETISIQMDKAAKELGMAIIGGHCEVTPNLPNPIVAGCAIGTTKKGNYVTAEGAKKGDKIILTKSVGIEGTAILASDKENELKKKLDMKTLLSAKNFYGKISVVKEAVLSFNSGAVHAMHDPTEGGLAGGIHEMADASKLGFEIYKEKIPIAFETAEICNFFQIDPLQLTASGSLLIAVDKNSADVVVRLLNRNQIDANVIGEFCSPQTKRTIVTKEGKWENLARPISDHLWLALTYS